MITKTQYGLLDDAMEYFNKKLFGGKLDDVLLVFKSKKNCFGTHHAEKFTDNKSGLKMTEISLNPDYFSGDRTPTDVLSTLVHEMVHQWHYMVGKPSRKGYHNAEWAGLMKEVGLYPSNTGEVGGKETGQSMSHYVIEGGEFEKACGAFLIKVGNPFLVFSEMASASEKSKKKTRFKFTCPECLQSAMAKKEANLMCGTDEVTMLIEEED